MIYPWNDCALGYIKALDTISTTTGVYTYNLGSAQGTSVLELVKAFEKVNGVTVHYKLVDRRPGDVATCYANADKAWKELNWNTVITMEDMCQDTWYWQSKNPNGYEG
ncbi:UDP-glucose 4-epimerase [Streptococcus suis 05ZYH33]|nr:UDP-glucose 4-epimerase [Streptococcus suis 05ZYH33]